MALEASFGCSMKERGGVPLLQWDAWLRDGVPHAVTTRHGGVSRGAYSSLNLGDAVGDAPAAVLANRAKLRAALGDMRRPLVIPRQVHGAEVFEVVEKPAPNTEPPEADALITNRDDVFLGLTFADCVPVLFYDPRNRAVGLAHGGWRGLAAGVVEKTVAAMAAAYGTLPEALEAAVGPHIGVCCYEVSSDVADRFASVTRAIRTDEQGRTFLNLSRVVRARLSEAGLRLENVSISSPCTSCFVEMYYSHRAESIRGEGATGRFAAAIGLDPMDGPGAGDEAEDSEAETETAPEAEPEVDEQDAPARVWRIDD